MRSKRKHFHRISHCILATLLVLSACGCGKSVNYSVDGDGSDSVSVSQGSLTDRLGVPEKCDREFGTGKSGLSKISCVTDDIDVPDADSLTKVYYEKAAYDSDAVKQAVEALLDKEKGISVREGDTYTKAEIQDNIDFYTEQQKLAAESGDDENASNYADMIEQWEAKLPSAPDSLPAVTEYRTGEVYYGDRNGIEYEVTFDDSGSYTYFRYWISENGVRESLGEVSGATTCAYQMDDGSISAYDMVNQCTIDEDGAATEAMNFLAEMGVTGMNVKESGPLLRVWSDDSGEVLKAEMNGYAFRFVRQINGAYVTDMLAGNADNLASQADGYVETTADFMYIYVNDTGVVSAYGAIYTDSGSVTCGEEENLLSWDEMLAKADDSLAAYYEKYPTNYDSVEFDRVSLVYLAYAEDDGRTCYIPAWEFLQSAYSSASEYDDTSNVGQIAYISAIDGSYIDLVENAKKLGNFEGSVGD